MKITFVTESHTFGDDKRTVDVARKKDLDEANARVEMLLQSIKKTDRRLKSVEKRLAPVEKSLVSVDERLREDCRAIFADLIEEALAPVFSVMKQQAKNGGQASSGGGDGREMRTGADMSRKISTKRRKSGEGKC